MKLPDSKHFEDVKLQLARVADAAAIGCMSRDLVEAGLGWWWTPPRIAQQIRCRDTVVLVALARSKLLGFAIMHFRDDDAHLNLLAVKPVYQRFGIGRQLIKWLEKSALVAGIAIIHLEVRVSNRHARIFYRAMGYQEIMRMPGYYRGRETAIRMMRDIRIHL